jgi:hypothetical protein
MAIKHNRPQSGYSDPTRRGDNPHEGVQHGVTNVNRFSANTRKAAPEAGTAKGSQASYSVTNSGGQAQGEGMGQVRAKYKEMRKGGLSPDESRGMATTELAYNAGSGPGGKQGPRIQMTKDAYGKSV